MSNINGHVQKRVVLTPNEETIIKFVSDIRFISINVTAGNILFKINDTISGLEDLGANILKDGESFDTTKSGPIYELHVLSSDSAELQWDIP